MGPQAPDVIDVGLSYGPSAKADGLIQPYKVSTWDTIPESAKDAEGYWYGDYYGVLSFEVNKDLVKNGEVPNSVWDLADARWKGRIAIAGTIERTTLSWLSALVHVMGEAKAKAYIERLVQNGLKILPDNSDVWRGVGSGEFALGLTNSPNYHLAIKAGLPVGVVYPDQGAEGMGSLVNPNAVAIVKGARNLSEAKRFVDFILSPEAQVILVQQAFEIPLVPGTDPGQVRPLSELKTLKISQERLADLEDPTIRLFPGF